MALLDVDSRSQIETQVRRVEKIETAIEPSFQEHFVQAMAIPHGTDRFPELAKQVDLPAPKAAPDNHTGGRRGRRRKRATSQD